MVRPSIINDEDIVTILSILVYEGSALTNTQIWKELNKWSQVVHKKDAPLRNNVYSRRVKPMMQHNLLKKIGNTRFAINWDGIVQRFLDSMPKQAYFHLDNVLPPKDRMTTLRKYIKYELCLSLWLYYRSVERVKSEFKVIQQLTEMRTRNLDELMMHIRARIMFSGLARTADWIMKDDWDQYTSQLPFYGEEDRATWKKMMDDLP